MALLNWSMTMVGYPPHARSGGRVVGLSHMSTFAAMRFAQEIGVRNGWLHADGALPQLQNVRQGAPTSVSLADMIGNQRVVMTEGLAQGTLTFAGATSAAKPPEDRPLSAWAEAAGQPWVQIVDNETAYWGGLDDARVARLLTWFVCQHPFEIDWRKVQLEARLARKLIGALFEHGWTRNLELVRADRRTCELWAGVHRTCILDHGARPLPGQVQVGVRLMVDFGEIGGKDLAERCPLSDDTGKLAPGRISGMWSG